MGLCYDCGFGALTVALALRLPGDCLPPRGPGGTDQHSELAVVEQVKRAEQLTADRDRFSLKVRWVRVCGSSLAARGPMERRASASLWQACPDTVLQRRVAIEVAGLAVWGGAQRRTKLTDEQVPLPLSTLASALPPEQGTIGPDHRHRPKRSVHFVHQWTEWTRWTGWTAVDAMFFNFLLAFRAGIAKFVRL